MSHKRVDNVLDSIKVTPIAAESLGVRSMCTLVETPDITILLDAGISLCPYRFNLPPHPTEFKTIASLRQSIAEAASEASVTSISHYHFDHHTPSFEDWVVNWTDDGKTAFQIYQGKTVFLKNPKENINSSQRQRAWMFKKTGGKHAKALVPADGKAFVYGKTNLRFSIAVPHGSEDLSLGWVIMTIIERGDERFLFAPDVQGPMSTHTLKLILDANPTLIMLGGPPFYLENFRVESAKLQQGIRNLEHVVKAVPLTILEHHALRDESYRSKIDRVFFQAHEVGHDVVTAAEYIGKENLFLESRRKQLYIDDSPSEEFKQWMKTLKNNKIFKPPI
jgi:predicted metallo-beta-lactamase superfamily hydrolase